MAIIIPSTASCSDEMNTEVLVCVTCRRPGDSPAALRAGQQLFDAISALAQEAPVEVRPIECMSGCSRACTIAFQARGKQSYLFGELPPDAASAEQVLACALLHQASLTGVLPRNARPERLQNGMIARLPPLLS